MRGSNFIDKTGKKFGRLSVLSIAEKVNGRLYYHCKCDCGCTKKVQGGHLRDKDSGTKSCGCLWTELQRKRHTKHGLSHTRLYHIWDAMKRRCNNPSHRNFKYYGGRGVTVCEEWMADFVVFYNWANQNGYKDTLELDRIDVNGNYEPCNCRWITHKGQNRNRTNNKWITIDGETKCLQEWLDLYHVNLKCYFKRLNRGWDENTAILTSVKKRI